MGAKSALVISLCLALSGTTIDAVSCVTAPVAQIYNINPEVTRRFNQLPGNRRERPDAEAEH